MFRRVGMIFAFAAVVIVGLATGAVAGTASSGWSQFAGWGAGNARHCVEHAATVYTPPSVINAYGKIRHKSHTPCETSNIPAGYLGVREALFREGGPICVDRAYTYNSSTTSEMSVPTNGGTGNCSTWTALASVARGKVYRSDTSQYVEAAAGLTSPYQN